MPPTDQPAPQRTRPGQSVADQLTARLKIITWLAIAAVATSAVSLMLVLVLLVSTLRFQGQMMGFCVALCDGILNAADGLTSIPPFPVSFEDAKIGAARAQLYAFAIELKIFALDVGRLTTDAEGLASLHTRPAGVPEWNGPYAKNPIPSDPWKHPYVFRRDGKSYDLYSVGPDGTDGTGDDVRQNE